MSDDSELQGQLRRGLADVASSVDVGQGSLQKVRLRAARRQSRQRMVTGGLGVVGVVAVFGISVSMLSGPGSDPRVVVAGSIPVSTSVPIVAAERDSEADDAGQGSSGAVVGERPSATTSAAAIAPAGQEPTMTTTAVDLPQWTADGPVLTGGTQFAVTDAGLMAIGGEERLLEDGDGWRSLPRTPGGVKPMEYAVDVTGTVRLIGIADAGGCAAAPVLVVHGGEGWLAEDLPLESVPGLRLELRAASTAMSPTLEAVSLVEELVPDLGCVLARAGRWGSEPEANDDGVAFIDDDGATAMVTWAELADVGVDRSLVDGAAPSVSRARWLVRRPGEAQWSEVPRTVDGGGYVTPDRLTYLGQSIVSYSGAGVRRLTLTGAEEWTEGAPLVIRPGAIVGLTPDGSWRVWTEWGAGPVSMPGPTLPDDSTVFDAVPTPRGVVVVFDGGTGVAVATPDAVTQMLDLGIDAEQWARLVSAGDRVRLVIGASGVQIMLGMVSD